jgi:hypothetical protein
MSLSPEAFIRGRLIRLSCDKLVKVKRTPDVLRRQIQILSVLKQAHNPCARFEPECSDLLRPRAHRLVVVMEQAPIQRLPTSPSTSSLALEKKEDDREVPSDSSMDQVDTDDQEPIEEDGSSMARKRKNHSNVDSIGTEKRHCDKEPASASSSSSSSRSRSCGAF